MLNRLLALLLLAAPVAFAADLEYKAGAKLQLVLANRTKCEVQVVSRQAGLVTIQPRKQQTGCPDVASILPLENVARVSRKRSLLQHFTRRVAVGFVMSVGMVASALLIEKGTTGQTVAGFGTMGGTIAASHKIFDGGYRWIVYLNRSQLDPA